MSGLSAALAKQHGLETKHVKVETCTTLTCLVHPYNEETEEGSYSHTARELLYDAQTVANSQKFANFMDYHSNSYRQKSDQSRRD